MAKDLLYWKKEFTKKEDASFLNSVRGFNNFVIYDSFRTEEGLTTEELKKLTRFLVSECLDRDLPIPSGGYNDLIAIGQQLEE